MTGPEDRMAHVNRVIDDVERMLAQQDWRRRQHRRRRVDRPAAVGGLAPVVDLAERRARRTLDELF
jgi:hypothetical protein